MMQDLVCNRNEVLTLLRRFGSHSLAYSTLQPGLKYFGDLQSGILAYTRILAHHIVLGDPICSESVMPTLFEQYLTTHSRAVFMQIHSTTARCLAQQGMRIVPVGVENDLDPCTFTLKGRKKEDLRHYRNKGREAALEFAELVDSEEAREVLHEISHKWLSHVARVGRGELRFLARPLEMHPEEGVRIFVAYHKGRPSGFVIMDPMYREGRCIGYAPVILRRIPGTPEGILDCINLYALEIFKMEALEVFSLGVSPFYDLVKNAGTQGPLPLPAYWLFRALYYLGTPIYSFKGLSFHKRRYRAQEVPVFAALQRRIGLVSSFAAAHACRML